jgi:hypothetical protein
MLFYFLYNFYLQHFSEGDVIKKYIGFHVK